jgi:lipopolysaccharide export system protein LptA
MKTLIVCVAVVGATSCAGGQVTSTHLTGITYAPSTKITASDITFDEAQRTTYARGQVRILSESSTITADEADVHLLNVSRTTNDMAVDLRGNVRVVITPSPTR